MRSDSSTPHDAYAAWRTPAFRRYLTGNFLAMIGRQMTNMAVGWEIYRRTQSPTLLGLVGLAAALPLFLFALPAGHLADHAPRKRIILGTQFVMMLAAFGLGCLSLWHTALPAAPLLDLPRQGLEWLVTHIDRQPHPVVDRGVVCMLALLFCASVAGTFGWTAKSSFIPLLVSKETLPNAISWNASIVKTAAAAGPALGGILIATFGFPVIYFIDSGTTLLFFTLLLPVRVSQPSLQKTANRAGEFLMGLRFVFQNKLVLPAMTLDLFAVLLGSIMALLPIFAERLGVGPVGLGWMITAEALGAILMSLLIAHFPPVKRVGRSILWAVAAFGLCIIGFGLTPWYWLALIFLFLHGACDAVNAVLRHTLVQLVTPDSLRGRVSAVNHVFIGSSNELGAFRGGLTAGFFGPVTAVVAGGIGTILVVCGVATLWPQFRRFGSFGEALQRGDSSPETAEASEDSPLSSSVAAAGSPSSPSSQGSGAVNPR